ncbi:endonuclease MutS2 [uncultured Duncaniella sp.]|uniref:endonuclease MutS2 n=1 Tax=uncultured Duncaniella sp. TaxID=2768039 RepID=UPI0025A94107|nr:Smr/MutS family protein [uncultured Duncaniella sp.]
MIYPERIEEKIGFSGVRTEISARCHCEGSRTRCEEMAFLADFNAIRTALTAVNEMLSANHSDETVPLEGVSDIDRNLAVIKIPGTFLEIKDLVRVRRMLDCFGAVATFLHRHKTDGRTPYPVLTDIAEELSYIPPSLGMLIDHAIDTTSGLVKDNASPTLAEIRSRLRGMSGRVNSILRRVLSSAISQGWLEPDTTPAVRDGRLVIPVPPMNKRKIQGIVHDESASGKTLFIEPAEVVEANNLTRELQLEEHREIIRILTSIADQLRPHIQEMQTGASIIYHLDFINAKAHYADAVGGTMPNLHDSAEMEWYHACHPVLKLSLERHNREIVPIDIRLDKNERILVISGPNAGGKSVCLKTVGTLQYMLQCGILPPVYDNSHFGVFKDMFVDIGDDQSFEDDLSTYSSHLRSMKFMLQRGRKGSLFLIDEMGSGTEPQIGGALARAILEQMNAKEMWGIVTTHYQILKQFAEDTPGLINGSMLYDRHLMQPMFKLSIGNPGSSFAVEIARKIGLPLEIISAAEDIVGKEYVNLDNYLLDITRDKRYWENKRTAIRQKEKKLEQMLAQYSEDAEQLRSKRRDIIEEARAEARKILDSSNAAIERTIADIKQANAERERTLEARRKLKEERLALEKDARNHRDNNAILSKAPKKKKGNSEPKPSGQTIAKAEIVVGTNVKLDGAGTVGTVLEISGKNAIVAFGNLKTNVKLDRLTATNAQPKSNAKSTVSMQTIDSGYERQLNFKQEIDLRGMRADEAIQAVTYFIDDAIRFSIARVRILHGTGTGALRQAVRALLSTTPGIESFHDEDVRFGGAGITVVNLK